VQAQRWLARGLGHARASEPGSTGGIWWQPPRRRFRAGARR